jgi:hypothetical protein
LYLANHSGGSTFAGNFGAPLPANPGADAASAADEERRGGAAAVAHHQRMDIVVNARPEFGFTSGKK